MEFNDTLNLEGIEPSYINSTNTDIKILPYQDPNSNQTLNLTNYELTWETTELTKNRWKVKMNFSLPKVFDVQVYNMFTTEKFKKIKLFNN